MKHRVVTVVVTSALELEAEAKSGYKAEKAKMNLNAAQMQRKVLPLAVASSYRAWAKMASAGKV